MLLSQAPSQQSRLGAAGIQEQAGTGQGVQLTHATAQPPLYWAMYEPRARLPRATSLPWAWSLGAFWVGLGMSLYQAASRNKCSVLWAMLEDAASEDVAARWVRTFGHDWRAAMGSCRAGLG